MSPKSKKNGLLEDGYKIPIVIAIFPGMVSSEDSPEGVDWVNEQLTLWIQKRLKSNA